MSADGEIAAGSDRAIRQKAVALKLSGGWRLLPFYPFGVMVLITLFLVWLARDASAGWLVPMVVFLPFMLAAVICRDAAAMRLWIDEQGLTYRGVGYTLQAPWERVKWGADGHGKALLVEDPAVSTSGWFGFMFQFAKAFAPLHGRRATAAMRSVPVYCFDSARVTQALSENAPAALSIRVDP